MRYLRLYLNFIRFSFSRAMEFRVDFFFRVVMDCVFYATNLIFFHILFDHIEGLGGLGLDEIYVFVAGYLFADAVTMTIFANNMWWLPQLINRGDLDYYLVRPVSSLFFVSLREFAANSFLNLIIAGGILGWALLRHPGDLGLGVMTIHVGLLLVGVFINWMVNLMFTLPVFWLHSNTGLRQLFLSLEVFGERPHRIYRGWVGRLLLSVLPLACIVSLPTFILFEGPSAETVWPMVLVPPLLFLVVQITWRRGLKSYASASS
ncbi:MAG: ABC-2 family transporter protein [Planctomycetota bacterium]